MCINNQGYEASLVTRKIYDMIPDEKARRDDFIRVIDESGEDYLYHISHFVRIELPAEVERTLVAVLSSLSPSRRDRSSRISPSAAP